MSETEKWTVKLKLPEHKLTKEDILFKVTLSTFACDASQVGATIYDPFAGSGTTMVAAQKANRRAFLMEKEPTFCDVIVRRYKFITGQALSVDVPAK